MINIFTKILTRFANCRNKALIDALAGENEKLKSKLNLYANSYLKNKEKWKIYIDLLNLIDSDNDIECLFCEVTKNVAKCTNNKNVYLIIYSDKDENQIFTMADKQNSKLYDKKYFQNMKCNEIKKLFCEILNIPHKIVRIQGIQKEYGYLFYELNENKKIGNDDYFIKTLCKYIALAIKDKEMGENYRYDNKNKVEFLINFSHELKTPLNGIITYSEFLKAEKNKFGEHIKKYIENINISARQLNYLMIDIVESAKSEYSQLKIVREKFLVNTEILNILSVFHSQIIAKKINVERILTEVEIYCDIAKFNQILYNLISNAIKFSPKNGTLRLCSWVEDRNFHFEIEDDGCGINERDKDKIFKFLSRANTTEQKEGSGIGLAISKKIIEIQGGKIGYRPKEPCGTIFWFYLPLDEWF